MKDPGNTGHKKGGTGHKKAAKKTGYKKMAAKKSSSHKKRGR